MNYKMILNTTGKVCILLAALMVLPLVVSLIYLEFTALIAFAVSIAISFAVGELLLRLCRPDKRDIYAKEGLIIAAIAWLAASALGAIPYTISGEIPFYVDALFETISGLTTTGSSVVKDVTALSHGVLFWRSFTHWVGGMGILVFVMAIASRSNDRSMNILRAEMPGPTVDKLVPRAKDTAKILYIIYFGMTVLLVVLLLFGKMSLFDALIHAFGTAGTGGFGMKPDCLASYSPYCQWIIAVFMLLFGVNFNLYYLVFIGKAKDFFKSEELHLYLGIVLVSTIAIAGNLYITSRNVEEAFRLSFFQVSSVITTTGFSTCDFDLWSNFSKSILLILMFIGGCAGSTAGGFKVSRVGILLKKIRFEMKKAVHPRTTAVIKFEGKRIENETISALGSYLAVYCVTLLGLFLLVSIDGTFDLESNFSAVAACFNNIGPAFGAFGPLSSFANASVFTKFVLSFAMLLGRLEIYPLLIAVNPVTWIKK